MICVLFIAFFCSCSHSVRSKGAFMTPPIIYDPVRISVIPDKNPREMVMLRGCGCKWKKCRFCDYHMDASPDAQANFELNRSVLDLVTGQYGCLEVINSGSFPELDEATMDYIEKVCIDRGIQRLHFECHWMYRKKCEALRERFRQKGITIQLKIGVESFDHEMRENVMVKGMAEDRPEEIARYFDEICLLFGLTGQSLASMEKDIRLGLQYFKRICINLMVENTAPLKPDAEVIRIFMENLYPLYRDNPRVDILLNNTDFGVGGEKDAE